MPPIETIPNTIDPDRIECLPAPSTTHELLFVGATQVDANRDGLIWFVTRSAPDRRPGAGRRRAHRRRQPARRGATAGRTAQRGGHRVRPRGRAVHGRCRVFIVPAALSGAGPASRSSSRSPTGCRPCPPRSAPRASTSSHGEHLLIGDAPLVFADVRRPAAPGPRARRPTAPARTSGRRATVLLAIGRRSPPRRVRGGSRRLRRAP